MDDTQVDLNEKQIIFDMTDESRLELSKERNSNSQLQAKLLETEKQLKESFIEITQLREDHSTEIKKLKSQIVFLKGQSRPGT